MKSKARPIAPTSEIVVDPARDKFRVSYFDHNDRRVTVNSIPAFYALAWLKCNVALRPSNSQRAITLFRGYILNHDKRAGYFALASLTRDCFSDDCAFLRAIGLAQEANWLAAKVSSQSLANRSPILADAQSLIDRHFIREGAFA